MAFRFATVAIVLNLIPIAAAWRNQSWGAVNIAWFVVPALNSVLALAALACIPLFKRDCPRFSLLRHLIFAFGLPAVLALLDWTIIASMHLILRA